MQKLRLLFLMLAAKLVIEELHLHTDVFFHFPNTHTALK
jgi:hypothetical protein